MTSHQIADLIHREGIELDRHALHLREPIKALGEYKIDVRVMPGVEAVVAVNVVPPSLTRTGGHARGRRACWAKTWKRGWEALDPEPIVALYAPDAVHFTEPFREPYRGREACAPTSSASFGEEEDPRVWIGEPIVDGDRAAISWWASLREEAPIRRSPAHRSCGSTPTASWSSSGTPGTSSTSGATRPTRRRSRPATPDRRRHPPAMAAVELPRGTSTDDLRTAGGEKCTRLSTGSLIISIGRPRADHRPAWDLRPVPDGPHQPGPAGRSARPQPEPASPCPPSASTGTDSATR